MARSRNLKPGYFVNDELAALGPYAQLLFSGLWCNADREGRLEDRPARIKIGTLPYYDVDVDDLLNSLHGAGFVLRYAVNSKRYLQIVNWERHQNPHKNEPESIIQAPTPEQYSTSTIQEPEQTSSNREGMKAKGQRYEGMKAKGDSPEPQDGSTPSNGEAITEIPLVNGTGYAVGQTQAARWATAFPAVDVPQELRTMAAWCAANPTRRKTSKGVERFIVNWLSKEQNRGGRGPPASDDDRRQQLADGARKRYLEDEAIRREQH